MHAHVLRPDGQNKVRCKWFDMEKLCGVLRLLHGRPCDAESMSARPHVDIIERNRDITVQYLITRTSVIDAWRRDTSPSLIT